MSEDDNEPSASGGILFAVLMVVLTVVFALLLLD